MKESDSHLAVRIAVIGDFQIGKSSLVKCLVPEALTEIGEGLDPTTSYVCDYRFAPGVHIVDTPGFNDTRVELTRKSEEEIKEADVVLFMQTDKAIEDRKDAILQLADRKPLIVLFNCWHKTIGRAGWIPESQKNVETCTKIQKWFSVAGMESSLLSIGGSPVLPINVLWAQFGLGQPIFGDQNEEDISDFARTKLHLDLTDSDLRAEMLHRSGFLLVRDFLRNLPLELLKHVVANPKREIDRIVDRFAEEFKKRWNAA